MTRSDFHSMFWAIIVVLGYFGFLINGIVLFSAINDEKKHTSIIQKSITHNINEEINKNLAAKSSEIYKKLFNHTHRYHDGKILE